MTITGARDYTTPARLRAARHLRAHGPRALLAGTTGAGVLAGFLSASGVTWPLLAYIGVVAAATALVLVVPALPHRVRSPNLLVRPDAGWRPDSDRPRALTAGVPLHDPVYGAGLRVLLAPSAPLVVISSNRRDVGLDHELPLPLFARRGERTQVQVDLREFGIPMAPYAFEREFPEGGQDADHTLAVKDLLFVPELAAALAPPGWPVPPPAEGFPLMMPEHCVDPVLLAHRDVVVVGGPDTNFWHGALFEPVAREFAVPASPVPLAIRLRDGSGAVPIYGSRSMSVQLSQLGASFPHTREDRAELDERLYPTYGMALAARNPFAAALGRSHWCVFVAGTRSLGTSGAVLGLVRMLRAMQADDALSFASAVPTSVPGRVAHVSAVLFRTRLVEQSVLRRDGELTARRRRDLGTAGRDPHYSDSYIPVGVEYLAYSGAAEPVWTRL